ncbi:MAG: helix-turn-helix transcriptional regulator [Thermodesulfobacteriota bacterium]|nr:helix-turn-helix transcriptional regulator [Thermodesulfobacteriota bacterium]
MAHKMTFGQFFKKMRGKKGLSLRRFCIENNLDPGNISKMERGLISPPQSREKLEQYVSYLEIKKGSDDWYEYFDLAAAHTGKIPDDLMEDDELVKKLPLVFRTIRGQKVSKEKLNKLAEAIRKS